MEKQIINIEIAYAEAEKQKIINLQIYAGTNIESALERSGMQRFFPNLDLKTCEVGIFSQAKKRDYVLRDGDRIEIYRPLIGDPKEIRRLRAKK